MCSGSPKAAGVRKMKKIRQILAIITIAVLLGVYAIAFISAFGHSPAASAWFRASLAATILLPILLYAILLVAKILTPTEPMLIDTVIFDVGGVLLDFPWTKFAMELDISEDARKAILEKVIDSPLFAECDLSVEPFETLVQKFCMIAPEYSAEIRLLIETMYTCIRPFPYTDEWLRSLKNRGYKLYILSNWSLHAYEKLSENGVMDFERYMDGSTWSFREHVRKPDQAIFETLIGKNHIDPAHAVFIDDNEENIKASRKAGIAAILFKDYSDARKKLMSLGVR